MNTFAGSPRFNTKPFRPNTDNSDYFCLVEDHKASWDGLNTFISVVFGVIGTLIVLGTFADIFREKGYDKKNPSYGLKLLLSFSLYTNFKEIMSTEVKVYLFPVLKRTSQKS